MVVWSLPIDKLDDTSGNGNRTPITDFDSSASNHDEQRQLFLDMFLITPPKHASSTRSDKKQNKNQSKGGGLRSMMMKKKKKKKKMSSSRDKKSKMGIKGGTMKKSSSSSDKKQYYYPPSHGKSSSKSKSSKDKKSYLHKTGKDKGFFSGEKGQDKGGFFDMSSSSSSSYKKNKNKLHHGKPTGNFVPLYTAYYANFVRLSANNPVVLYNVEPKGLAVQVHVKVPKIGGVSVVYTAQPVQVGDPCPFQKQSKPKFIEEDTAVVICQGSVSIGVLYQTFLDSKALGLVSVTLSTREANIFFSSEYIRSIDPSCSDHLSYKPFCCASNNSHLTLTLSR